jgi:hypothetical protein
VDERRLHKPEIGNPNRRKPDSKIVAAEEEYPSIVPGFKAWPTPTAPLWGTLYAIPPYLAGIYALLHISTSRAYVGCTEDILWRCLAHLRELRARGHANRGLTEAWNCDGPQGFHVIVLEPTRCAKNLIRRETYWIERLNSMHPNGFNRMKCSSY